MVAKVISLFVKPNSKKKYVKLIDADTYEIAITAKPEKGKANKEIIEDLADFFKIQKSRIRIIKGHKSHTKLVEIAEDQ
ncbi:MAG: DUF167 domain-containing protein [Candidatus Helarchaeota archaeon]|nr:DUF167 domain-containing protein [Candidatus Helarchaeota archaeon]